MINEYLLQMLHSFAANPKPLWNSETGIFLLGARSMSETVNDAAYSQVIGQYMERIVEPDGTIRSLCTAEPDLGRINTGRLLFSLTASDNERRSRGAIEALMNMLRKQPRTKNGLFWYKASLPNQVWLDGLYMALPFYMEYENRFNEKVNYNDIYSQMTQARTLLFDPERHLYHPFINESCSAANTQISELSFRCPLRSIGLHLMNLIDLFELSSEEVFEQHMQYAIWMKEALRGILPRLDPESSLFRSFPDQPDEHGNDTDTAGSAMIAYAVFKGCRLGALLSEKYRDTGEQILKALTESRLVQDGSRIHLVETGSALLPNGNQGKQDKLTGTGALMLAYSEYLKLRQQDIL